MMVQANDWSLAAVALQGDHRFDTLGKTVTAHVVAVLEILEFVWHKARHYFSLTTIASLAPRHLPLMWQFTNK